PVRPVHQTGQAGRNKTERLHAQPASVQPTFHPSALWQMNLAQQEQKSTSWAPEIIWVATNPEQLILNKTYPTSGYNLAHICRHASLLAGGYFAEKRLK